MDDTQNLFTICGVPIVLDERDREFGSYFQNSRMAYSGKISDYKSVLTKTVRSANENNVFNLFAECTIAYSSIFHSFFDVFWNYLMEKKIYEMNKDSVRGTLLNRWLDMNKEMSQDCISVGVYLIKCKTQSPTQGGLLAGIQDLRSSPQKIDEICSTITLACELMVIMYEPEQVRQYGVLENDYDYMRFLNIQENLSDLGLNEHTVVDYVSNIKLFPHNVASYFNILCQFGDRDHEIESLMEFIYMGEIARALKYSIVNTKYPAFKNEKEYKNYSESQLIEMATAINGFEQYMGINYPIELPHLSNIKKRLDEIDIEERTANGKLYETREEAQDVRLRSFDGIEYESVELANMVREEVTTIRETYAAAGFGMMKKYEAVQNLLGMEFITETAKEELERLRVDIEAKYQKRQDFNKKISNTTSFIKSKALRIFGRRTSNDHNDSNKAVVHSGTDSSQTRETMFCPYCGNKIKAGSRFCLHCGENLEDI